MVQPTDRVLAKLSIRVLGFFAALSGISPAHAAETLTIAANVAVGDNDELAEAYSALLKEVRDELQAEVTGMAVSNVDSNPNTALDTRGTDTPASDYEYRKSDDWD